MTDQEKYEAWLKMGEELANAPNLHEGKRSFIRNLVVVLKKADAVQASTASIPKDITDLPEEPRYENDCPHCVFLGHFDATEDTRKYDLYFCKQNFLTVTARWSSQSQHYLSGLDAAEVTPSLKEARRRAQAKGLLTL